MLLAACEVGISMTIERKIRLMERRMDAFNFDVTTAATGDPESM